MSEQEQPNETKLPVNDDLTNRVNSAYVANDYTLLNGGKENIVMVKGNKDEVSIDMLLTLQGMEEVCQTLRELVNKKPEDE